MARPAQRSGLWRVIAPTILLPLLGIALLPLAEFGLSATPGTAVMGQHKVEASGKFVVITQNAYQTIWGGYSYGPEIAAEQEEAERKQKEWEREHAEEIAKMKRDMEQWARDHAGELAKARKDAEKWAKGAGVKPVKQKPDPAFLMILYFVGLVGAVVVGYALPVGRVRVIVFASTVAVTTVLLAVQTAVGLPLKEFVAERAEQFQQEQKFIDDMTRPFGQFGVNVKVEVPKPYYRLTPMSLLGWPFLFGAVLVACGEEMIAMIGGGGGGKKKPKKQSRDDEDDEDEDDEPRPKKRSRVYHDD